MIRSFSQIPITYKIAIKFALFVGLLMMILGVSIYFFYENLLVKEEETSLRIKVESLLDEYNSGETFSATPPTDLITLAESIASNGYQVSIYHAGNMENIFHTDIHPLEIFKVKVPGFSLLEGRHDEDTMIYSRMKDDILFVAYTSSSHLDSSLTNLLIALISVIIIAFFASFILGYIFARDALLPVRTLIDDISGLGLHGDVRGVELPMAKDEIYVLSETFNEFFKRIQKAFQREKEFVQDVSHELRTPLTIMRSSLELIEKKGNSREILDTKIPLLTKALEKMESLVSELFILESKATQVDTMNTSLSDFSKEIITDYISIAQEKGLNIEYSQKGDFTVSTEKGLLQKVLGNILKNAILYTEVGMISIYVNEDDRSIIIADTGIGMDEDSLKKVWERFYRVDRSRTSKKYTGSGLGLSIVKKICDDEGWRIEMTSEVGVGTKCMIYF